MFATENLIYKIFYIIIPCDFMVLRKLWHTTKGLRNPKKNWRVQSAGMSVSNEISRFTKSFKENFITLIISAMGLVVALSWNNFWNAWVSTLTVENTLFYKLVIAVMMTLFAVVLTYVFSRLKSNGD